MKRAEEDPYKSFIEMQQRMAGAAAKQPGAGVGEIISPPPEIKVSFNGMTLDKRFLWVDQYWVQGHTRTHKGHIVSETQPRSGGSGYALFESHTHEIHNDYTDEETLTDTWKVGDHVMLVPLLDDENKKAVQYAVFGKFVTLDGN